MGMRENEEKYISNKCGKNSSKWNKYTQESNNAQMLMDNRPWSVWPDVEGQRSVDMGTWRMVEVASLVCEEGL